MIDDNFVEILDIDDIHVDDEQVKSRLQISDEKWDSFRNLGEQARELYERLK